MPQQASSVLIRRKTCFNSMELIETESLRSRSDCEERNLLISSRTFRRV